MDIGCKLYELRKNTGLDATTFAGMVGISKSYVHKLEKNQSVPTVYVLQRWIACARPEDDNDVDKIKMERWLELSLSFLFENGFLDSEDDNNVEDNSQRELVVAKMPKVLTRMLPTHFLYKIYMKITKRGQ